MRQTNLEWLYAHVAYKGDGCLTWPFSTCKGYPTVGVNRKVKRASRVMCEAVHGPAPSPAHEAAHLCGNGHLACIHPQHIVWKTKSANQLDRRRHGTSRTNRHGSGGALTPEQADQIMAAQGTAMAIGKKFGVSEHTVLRIKSGRTYSKPRTRYMIFEAMREAGSPLSAKELAERLGSTWRTMGSTLSILCREGAIIRVKMGRYTLPAAAVAA